MNIGISKNPTFLKRRWIFILLQERKIDKTGDVIMTKEIFENYTGLLHCLSCDQDVPKTHIFYKKVHSNGDILRCNVCEWIKKYPDKMHHKKFTYDEIVRFLHFFIYEESIYLNQLSEIMNRNIDDLIELFQFLKLGNKKCLIRTNCEYCGNSCEFPPQAYLNSNYHYCSHECYYLDKSNKTLKGIDSPYYNRINTTCTNCNKPIEVIPYDYNITNQYGDNHNFCCQECYWDYRSKYYIKDKAYNYHRLFSLEERESARQRMLNRLNSSDRLNTSIQILIDKCLDNLGIKYIREYLLDYYSIDNYLVKSNGMIEVMGDYWHTSPLYYNENKLINEMQSKQLNRDKIKYSYILNHYNTHILYLWETDIKERLDVCINLIQLYINNGLILPNYHSFNWIIDTEKLQLKEDLIIPYQDISINEYRHLICYSNVA